MTNVRLVNNRGFGSRAVGAVEGYCSHQSIEASETLRIMASADPPGRFQIEIFRMGYYGGAGTRVMRPRSPIHRLDTIGCVNANGNRAPN